MQQANQGTLARNHPLMNGSALRIGIVQARFNLEITQALLAACQRELTNLGVTQIDNVQVSGALEIPIALQTMARKGRYDALIAIGCIVRGATYHFELVAQESGRGVSQVSLEHQVPIVNTILTVNTVQQGRERQEDKGRDAAQIAVEMANLVKGLS